MNIIQKFAVLGVFYECDIFSSYSDTSLAVKRDVLGSNYKLVAN